MEDTEPALEPDPGFVLRGAQAADLDFVRASWRRSYDYRPCPGGVREYIETQSAVIEQCLRTSEVVIACPRPAEQHGQILGWVCARASDVIHYVFVKPYYRRNRIATALLNVVVQPRAQVVFTTHDFDNVPHKRDGIRTIVAQARQRGLSFTYNPALIFGPPREEWMPR